MKPLPAWAYIDSRDGLHIDIPRFLAENGVEDTPANREIFAQVALEAAAEVFPGVPIFEDDARVDPFTGRRRP